jgi:hypothetical protein
VYLWNINKLKGDLLAGKVTERGTFQYVLVSTLFLGLVIIEYGVASDLDTISSVVSYVIAVLSLFVFYRCNGGKNGKDFLKRYVAMGVVVTVRFIVMVILPILISLALAKYFIFGIISDQTDLIDVISFVFLEMIYVFLLAWHFKSIPKISMIENS